MRNMPPALDRSLLTDPARCPACGGRLDGPVCRWCAADLSDPLAVRVWEMSARIAGLLDERDALLARLPRRPAPPTTPPPGTAPRGVPSPHGESPGGPGTTLPPAAPPRGATPTTATPTTATPATGCPAPASRPVLGVQQLLLALGALLLSIAVIVFLAYSWTRVGLGGRAAIVAGLTLGLLTLAGWTRARLSSTAEALGGVSVVLLAADVWAVRRTGVLGSDEIPLADHVAAGCAVSLLVLLAASRASRVRAWSLSAAVLLPVCPAAAGAALHGHTGDLAWLGAGLVLGAASTVVRATLPRDLRPERGTLAVSAAVALGACLPVVTAVALTSSTFTAGALLAAASAAAATQAAPSGASWGARTAWWALSGVMASGAAVCAGVWAVQRTPLDAVHVLATCPALVAVVVLLARWRGGHGAAHAAWAVWALVILPALLLTAVHLLRTALLVLTPWSHPVGGSLLRAGGSLRLGEADPTRQGWSACLLAFAVAAALGTVLLRTTAGRARLPLVPVVARTGAGGAVLLAATEPDLPLGAAVALLLTVLAAGIAVRLLRPPTSGVLPTASVAGTLGVLAAWAARPSSVPATLVGIAALLAARRVVRAQETRRLLVAAAGGAGVVAAGAVPGLLGHPVADRLTVAGVAGAVLTTLLLTVPGVRGLPPATPATPVPPVLRRATWGTLPWTGTERLSCAAPAMLAVLSGAAFLLLGRDLSVDARYLRLQVLLAVASAAALVVVGRTPALPVRSAMPRGGTIVAGVAAGTAPVLVASLAAVSAVRGDHASAACLLLAVVAALTGAASTLAEAAGPRACGQCPVSRLRGPLTAPGCVVVGAQSAAVDPSCRRAGHSPGHLLVREGHCPQALRDARRRGAEAGALLVGLASLVTVPSAQWAWVVLMVLGAGATAVASAPDRRMVGWPAGVLLTASTWVRLTLSDVDVVEAYTLPPATALLVVGLVRLRRTVRAGTGTPTATREVVAREGTPTVGGRAGWRHLLPGTALALVPSVLAAGHGSRLRPALVLLVALGLVAGSRRVPDRWQGPFLLGVGGLTAAATAGVRVLTALVRRVDPALLRAEGMPPLDVELWSVPAAAVLSVACLAARAPGRYLPAEAAVLVAGGPTLLVAVLVPGPWSAGRLAVVTGCAAVLALVATPGAPGGRALALRGTRVWGLATALCAVGAAFGWVRGVGPCEEAWSLTPAVVLLVRGWWDMTHDLRRSSWRAVGPGLAVALLPSLLLALGGTGTVRAVGLVAGAVGVLLAGVVARWQAPVTLGAGVAAVHALHLLGPGVVGAVDAVPRWVVLAVAGVLLLVVGATYEQRLRDLRAVRLRFGALR